MVVEGIWQEVNVLGAVEEKLAKGRLLCYALYVFV